MTSAPIMIGRYKILEEIGRGGMGIVYKAHDPHPMLQRLVALKVLPPEHKTQQDVVARFIHEARHAAALDHPHIIKIYDAGEEGGTPYFAMQYVDGTTLADLLKQGCCPPERIVPLIDAISGALDHAHQHGVVHRDIKPTNILLDRQSNVFVTDFGIAHAVGGTVYTQAGALLGTPAYMSPEQARGDAQVDARSDIYSLGIVLFELLTGRVPFQADTAVGIAVKQINEPPPSPRLFNPAVSLAVEAVVMRALDKDPLRRYQRASDLARDLKQAMVPQMALPAARMATAPAGMATVHAGGMPPMMETRAAPIPSTLPPNRKVVWPWVVGGMGACAVLFMLFLFGGLMLLTDAARTGQEGSPDPPANLQGLPNTPVVPGRNPSPPVKAKGNPFAGHWTGSDTDSLGNSETFTIAIKPNGRFIEVARSARNGQLTRVTGSIQKDGNGVNSYLVNRKLVTIKMQIKMDRRGHALTHSEGYIGSSTMPVLTSQGEMTRE